MKRRTKIISAVMALAILVCVFAVLATSFAVDTSSEKAQPSELTLRLWAITG